MQDLYIYIYILIIVNLFRFGRLMQKSFGKLKLSRVLTKNVFLKSYLICIYRKKRRNRTYEVTK